MSKKKREKGFTLIELIIVFTLIVYWLAWAFLNIKTPPNGHGNRYSRKIFSL